MATAAGGPKGLLAFAAQSYWCRDVDRWRVNVVASLEKHLADKANALLPNLTASWPPDMGEPRHERSIQWVEPWLRESIAELRNLWEVLGAHGIPGERINPGEGVRQRRWPVRLLRFVFAPVGGAVQDVIKYTTLIVLGSALLWITGGALGMNIPQLPDLRRIVTPTVPFPCVARSDAVTVYVDSDLRGECRSFGVGEHDLGDFAGRVSSVFNPGNVFSWVLYDATGRPGRFDETMGQLPGDWNNQAISIKVERHAAAP